MDFYIYGGKKSAQSGKSLTVAFIHEGLGTYFTAPDRKIVVGGLRSTNATWDYPPLPGLLLPVNEATGRIHVVVGHYDERTGQLAVCLDGPEARERRDRLRYLVAELAAHPDALRPLASALRPGAMALLRLARHPNALDFYRCQVPSPSFLLCDPIDRRRGRGQVKSETKEGLYTVYLVDEAVEMSHIRAADLLEFPSRLLHVHFTSTVHL